MTFANETVTIRPENTPAARALATRLEEGALTLSFSDFAGNEKIASPDPPLVFTDTEGCDPDTGDLTVYIPWGNLAAFILRRLYSDLFLLSEFKFMNFGESPFRFFVDSICMMILFEERNGTAARFQNKTVIEKTKNSGRTPEPVFQIIDFSANQNSLPGNRGMPSNPFFKSASVGIKSVIWPSLKDS